MRMLEIWREANANMDDYLELDEARDFFDRARRVFTSLEFPDSEEGFQQFMQDCDDNQSGVISKREFENWFMERGKALKFKWMK